MYSNGAIEDPIRTVNHGIEHRAWCFRDRARMDLLLEMIRLRLGGWARSMLTVGSSATISR